MGLSPSLPALVLFALPALATGASVTSTSTPSAVPLEPIAAMVDAFRSHSVVALGEGAHGNEPGHRFRLSLIRDPRFAATVNDIVVECGSARYQDLMDRFVNGEDVAERALRQVWQNVTVPNGVWDGPMYEEFFRAVRAVNRALAREHRLRVLLGDPPIDWDAVRSWADVRHWMGQRDDYPAELVRREVLAKHRRALIIYGDGHLWRKDLGENLVQLLEKSDGTKVFTIAVVGTLPGTSDVTTLQADIATWPRPSLTILRGTGVGAADFLFFYSVGLGGPKYQYASLRMEDQFDALLYLGPAPATMPQPLPPELCADPEYMEMRLSRLRLMPSSRPPDPVERFRQYCSTAPPR